MNQKSIGVLAIILCAVMFSLYLAVNILAGHGNPIGELVKWFAIIGFVIGLLAPRGALALFAVLQFYMDLFKRLMAFGDSMAMNDIMAALSLGPSLVVAACVSCVLGWMSGKYRLNRMDFNFFILAFSFSLVGISTAGSTSVVDIGQALLGSAMIGMTAFAWSVLMRERDDSIYYFKLILLGAVPMGLYTFWQWGMGISRWEANYIEKGYSRVLFAHYLVHLQTGIRMRPFSTLNLHVSVGAVAGVLSCVGLFLAPKAQYYLRAKKSTGALYLLLGVFYIGVCIFSTNRTTYFLLPLAIVLVWCFNSRFRTLAFYIAFPASFIVIALNSRFLSEHLEEVNAKFARTFFGSWFGHIGTYGDRLRSFMVLTDGTFWEPFGYPAGKRPLTHDSLSAILVSVGYVPLIAFLLILIAVAVWWHRAILSTRNEQERWLLVRVTAIIVALCICGLAYGNVIFVSPCNSMLGALIAIAYCAIRRERERALLPEPAEVHEPIAMRRPLRHRPFTALR